MVEAQARGFTHEKTYAGESNEWYTPPYIFDALGLEFDLDPCSPGPGKTFVPAKKHYTVESDGLLQPWEGLAWVNPPYGPETAKWLKKLAAHGNGMALVFARTETKWFQEAAKASDLFCLVTPRIRFYKGDTVTRGGPPGCGSALFAYGDAAVEALKHSNLGLCFSTH